MYLTMSFRMHLLMYLYNAPSNDNVPSQRPSGITLPNDKEEAPFTSASKTRASKTRPRPGAGAHTEGDDGDAGGDDNDDAAWDSNEETSTASKKPTPPSDKHSLQKTQKVPRKKDTAASVDAPKKKKKHKKKRDRPFDKNPLDQAVSDLHSAQAAAELHASLEGQADTIRHKRTKKDGPSPPGTTAALRDATIMGQYSFYREVLRECAHEIAPTNPPIMPMFFPGSGSTDAYHYLNNRYPDLQREHKKSPANETKFGPQVCRRSHTHPRTHPSSLSTP